jgi:predicted nucleic acid-binding protein
VILYLDSSALVKRYVLEEGSMVVTDAIAEAEMIATSVVTRAEISGAFAKSIRTGLLSWDEASAARRSAHDDWPSLIRVQLNEAVALKADELAWEFGLRGYDAVQLACASVWKDAIQSEVVLATFDRQLRDAAVRRDFVVLPETAA